MLRKNIKKYVIFNVLPGKSTDRIFPPGSNGVSLKSLILYGKTDTTYAFCINVLHYWNPWISMGLLSKNEPFRSIIFLNVFHNAVCLKSLNTYGITNKVLHLISMFSIMLYQWNHWNSYGMARKMLHIIHTNCASKYIKVAFCLRFFLMCSLYTISLFLWLLAASKARTASLSTPILCHKINLYGS